MADTIHDVSGIIDRSHGERVLTEQESNACAPRTSSGRRTNPCRTVGTDLYDVAGLQRARVGAADRLIGNGGCKIPRYAGVLAQAGYLGNGRRAANA